jgi:predicted ATPase
MRLKSIYISEYKNLKKFQLSFNENSFIDVFVGKNGSGKSNLFEALIEIFHHVYEYDNKTFTPSFDYTIEYKIEGQNVKLEYHSETLKINNRERKTLGKTPLPDNLLIYYSGHNETVTSLIKTYEETFRKRIKSASLNESRRFIGINSEYKELFLTILLIQEESNKARQFILKKLGIQFVNSEIKLILKRPFYALINPTYGIEIGYNNERYWNVAGITKDFLERLTKCISTATGSIVRDEGFFPAKDIYIHYLDINKIQQEFTNLTTQELFRQFDNLKILDMIQEISIPIKLIGNIDANINDFSDGQFQSVYIYSLIELFKDRNCITLLDEPDCFLHPKWQHEFLTQVFDITEDTAQNNHLLMTSHSAMTLCNLNEKTLSLFQIGENNQVFCKQSTKKEVVQELSNSLILYSEDESKLLIDNAIRSSNKPVLFTEGITDVYILNTAYEKLYPNEEIPILIQDTFDYGFLATLFKRNDLFNNHKNKTFFALFDFDEAYHKGWLSLPTDDEDNDEIEDIEKGLCKKLKNKKAYAFMLPVPNNILKEQVYTVKSSTRHIKIKPHFGIEHLFYDCLGSDKDKWFYNDRQNIIQFKNDDKKIQFAKDIIPTFEKKDFEIFRPLFEFIKSKSGIST